MTSAERIVAARRATGLTQAQAARVIGLARQNLNRYERGRTEPLASTLARILQALEGIGGRRLSKSHRSAGSGR